ncbi:M23 family metallopeptidase [Rathayibacter tanaceti]|uniref:Murein DD-endopeptidase MepM n=2 Tax=Rathayibacter tanaceti TaxID=1671680 RepID=A0A162GNU7_9MICO|nr:M23 family metallopeptidase [Rathayibacter tanaceti]KZX20538.1 Murein DD-endopeptidase MepM [Rathayibacter tanaceti]QHC54668.1 peptidoglycan DD-metalloendopeptidase family protein [Rathayibacter tanaceti]TCO37525.1 peptidase M23-like protein [Rathayibacter tanaceti]
MAAFLALSPAFFDAESAHAATYVQYRHPFTNPNVADGWGATAGRARPHRGLDYPQAGGTAIPAAADGVVVVNLRNSDLGYVVVLRHADGYHSAYCHMNAASPLPIGRSVARGERVGSVGNTGNASRGNHLHLTISLSESGYSYGVTVDPYRFINDRLKPAPAPAEPTIQEDDMQMIVVYADAATGSEYGSTGVITSRRGFVQTSSKLGSREELDAWTSIANALGYQISERHVDTNGFILASRF